MRTRDAARPFRAFQKYFYEKPPSAVQHTAAPSVQKWLGSIASYLLHGAEDSRAVTRGGTTYTMNTAPCPPWFAASRRSYPRSLATNYREPIGSNYRYHYRGATK